LGRGAGAGFSLVQAEEERQPSASNAISMWDNIFFILKLPEVKNVIKVVSAESL
jgi:hypothetical protein